MSWVRAEAISLNRQATTVPTEAHSTKKAWIPAHVHGAAKAAVPIPLPATVTTADTLPPGPITADTRDALLAQPEAANTAVIVNEFGEVGIDHELVRNAAEAVAGLFAAVAAIAPD